MDKKIDIIKTDIEGLYILKINKFSDERGSFSRLFDSDELFKILGSKKIVQVNHSKTLEKGTLRGLHFQKSFHQETKIIRCLKGRIYDTVVDIRKGSKTFLKTFSIELCENEDIMIFVPEGFAHGFQALEDNIEMLYFHTNFYSPLAESALNLLDPKLNISWPLDVNKISQRDKSIPLINKNFEGIEVEV